MNYVGVFYIGAMMKIFYYYYTVFLAITAGLDSPLKGSMPNHSFVREKREYKKRELSILEQIGDDSELTTAKLVAETFGLTPLSQTPSSAKLSQTPSSTKSRKSNLSLSLSPLDCRTKQEDDPMVLELERKIREFDVTRASAVWLGNQLRKFRQNNPAKNLVAVSLIEKLHNRVAFPLREYFMDEKALFDKNTYNDFLENCLPCACDDDPFSSDMRAIQESSVRRSGRGFEE